MERQKQTHVVVVSTFRHDYVDGKGAQKELVNSFVKTSLESAIKAVRYHAATSNPDTIYNIYEIGDLAGYAMHKIIVNLNKKEGE